VCNLWYASAFSFSGAARCPPPASTSRSRCTRDAGRPPRRPSTRRGWPPGKTHHRVYQIEVTDWVLYDEEHFRGQPRQAVEAHS
jgi:hypothetical protein